MRRLTALLVFVLLRATVSAEPEYQGRPTKYWQTEAASKNPLDRKKAIEALNALGEVVAIADLLGDVEPDVRTAAIKAIRDSGRQAVPKLIAEARKSWPQNSPSADGLVVIGEAAVPDLIRLLREGQAPRAPPVLKGASLTLGRIGPPAKAAIPDLAKVARIQGFENWPGAAVYALAQVDTEGKTSVPVIAEAMESWEDGVRGWAERGLVKIGPRAVPLLIQVLQNKQGAGREGAAEALSRFGPKAKTAIPALRQALNDSDSMLRLKAKMAIKEIDAAQEDRKPDSH